MEVAGTVVIVERGGIFLDVSVSSLSSFFFSWVKFPTRRWIYSNGVFIAAYSLWLALHASP
jgi:hypothetical protein